LDKNLTNTLFPVVLDGFLFTNLLYWFWTIWGGAGRRF